MIPYLPVVFTYTFPRSMHTEEQTLDVQELGEARLRALRDMERSETGRQSVNEPAFGYPFRWGDCWRQCMEYRVNDFAAEVGFFADLLGFPVNACSSDYFMFTSPDGAFFFAIAAASDDVTATPAGAIRIQFMIDGIIDTAHELEQRGINFEKFPEPCELNSPLHTGTFRTPNGVAVDLWGMVEQKKERMW
jgi:hypothetical protein